MNKNKIRYNKSNLRIAPQASNFSQPQTVPFIFDLTGPANGPNINDNFIDNNNNNIDRINDNDNQQDNNNNTNTLILPHNTAKFASSQSSPSLEDTSNTISVATLNVRGINNQTKFDSIMDDFLQKDTSIFGLTETLLTSQSGDTMFKNYITTWHTTHVYRSYWDYDPNDRNSGVGIIIKAFVAKYIQKITRHKGRYIAIDLYLPARKLRIINIYNHQRRDWFDHTHTRKDGPGKKLALFIMEQIKQAESSGFVVIIMGDFNVNPTTYLTKLASGRNPDAYYGLIQFLHDKNYIDQHPKDDNNREYATWYRTPSTPSSRIDLIWYSDSLIRDDFCFDELWQLPSTINTSRTFHPLDHRCLIVYFTKHLLLNDLPLHRKKQKQEWRTIFDVSNATKQEWDDFISIQDDKFVLLQEQPTDLPRSSPLSVDQCFLNYNWHLFVTAIKQAAHETIPKKKFSPFLNTNNKLSEDLIHLRKQTSLLNNIYALIHNWLYDLRGSSIKAANIQRKWTLNGDLSRRSCLLTINKQYNNIIDPLSVPFLLNRSPRTELTDLLKNIAI